MFRLELRFRDFLHDVLPRTDCRDVGVRVRHQLVMESIHVCPLPPLSNPSRPSKQRDMLCTTQQVNVSLSMSHDALRWQSQNPEPSFQDLEKPLDLFSYALKCLLHLIISAMAVFPHAVHSIRILHSRRKRR